MNTITVVDYGCGNILSVARAIEYSGNKCKVISNPKDIEKAEKLILPGVGNFGFAISKIKKKNLEYAIKIFLEKDRPFMGICLGMQLIYSESDEKKGSKGLGFFDGKVEKIGKKNKNILVPHIGWNFISDDTQCKVFSENILKNIKPFDQFYFVHSYKVIDLEMKNLKIFTDYGGEKICTSVLSDNKFLFQFHPEKSGEKGLKIYENFCKI